MRATGKMEGNEVLGAAGLEGAGHSQTCAIQNSDVAWSASRKATVRGDTCCQMHLCCQTGRGIFTQVGWNYAELNLVPIRPGLRAKQAGSIFTK